MYVVPFIYVLRTGRFIKGVLLTWVLMILTTFMLSGVIYALVHHLLAPEIAAEFLPEGNALAASFFVGWFFGLVISSVAYLIRSAVKDREAKQKSEEASDNR